MSNRFDGRALDQLRPVRITTHFTDAPMGSVLIECGNSFSASADVLSKFFSSIVGTHLHK